MLSRRQIIAAMGAVPALAAASRALAAPPTPITEVLEQFIQKAMRNSPQLLTLMGADSGPFAKARTQLDDRSLRRGVGGVGGWRGTCARTAPPRLHSRLVFDHDAVHLRQ